jgi:hypothetical protein
MTDTPITPEAVEHFTATALEGRAMTDALGIGQDPDGRYWAGEDGEFKIGTLFKNADGGVFEPYLVQTFFDADGKVMGIDLPDTAKQAFADQSASLVKAALGRAAAYHDNIAAHDQGGIDYSDAVGIPISNRADLERSVRVAEMDAAAIRAIANDPEAVASIVASVMGDKG